MIPTISVSPLRPNVTIMSFDNVRPLEALESELKAKVQEVRSVLDLENSLGFLSVAGPVGSLAGLCGVLLGPLGVVVGVPAAAGLLYKSTKWGAQALDLQKRREDLTSEQTRLVRQCISLYLTETGSVDQAYHILNSKIFSQQKRDGRKSILPHQISRDSYPLYW